MACFQSAGRVHDLTALEPPLVQRACSFLLIGFARFVKSCPAALHESALLISTYSNTTAEPQIEKAHAEATLKPVLQLWPAPGIGDGCWRPSLVGWRPLLLETQKRKRQLHPHAAYINAFSRLKSDRRSVNPHKSCNPISRSKMVQGYWVLC